MAQLEQRLVQLLLELVLHGANVLDRQAMPLVDAAEYVLVALCDDVNFLILSALVASVVNEGIPRCALFIRPLLNLGAIV